MIDFIFVVKDPVTWHDKNLERNPNDYSWLRAFGSNGITNVQNYGTAGFYFNTLVQHNDLVRSYL